ncbi:hypothetical protein pb186bvf_006899 [Paramecium bursaria]
MVEWIFGQTYGQYNLIEKDKNICGGPDYDLIAPLEVLVGATGQFNLVLQLQGYNTTLLNTSFGMFDITISYQPCEFPIRCATCDDNGCLTCSVPDRILSPLCLCPTYEYLSYSECPTCPYKCQGNLCNLEGCTVCEETHLIVYAQRMRFMVLVLVRFVSNIAYFAQLICAQNVKQDIIHMVNIVLCPYQCSTCLFNGCLTCSDPQRGPAPFFRCPSYEIIGQQQCPSCQQNCQTCDQTGCLMIIAKLVINTNAYHAKEMIWCYHIVFVHMVMKIFRIVVNKLLKLQRDYYWILQLIFPYCFRQQQYSNLVKLCTMLLSDWSIYETQTFHLPQGVLSKNYTYLIIGQIIDKFGYLYNKTGYVQVLPNQNFNFIDYLLQEFQSEQYYEKMLYLGSQYLQVQQDRCNTNCSSNGVCTNHQCICQTLYYLLDCSANQTQQSNLTISINKLLSDLISNDLVDNTYLTLLLNLMNNNYVQSEITKYFMVRLVEQVVQNMQALVNQQQIYSNNIDEFIQILTNPQSYIDQLRLDQQLMYLIQLVDISQAILLNNHYFSNTTLQNELSLKLLNIAIRILNCSQLHIDQNAFQLRLNNFEITAYRVSSNYSQLFFNQPISMQNQINFLEDQSIIQLQNDSLFHQFFFMLILASVQVYDSNGSQYRSFQPITTQLKADNVSKSSNIVCIGQQNGKWISKICQTIKITNSNVTSCQCDTLDQQSVVDDVNNLYTNSKIYTLQNYDSIFKFQFYISVLAYLSQQLIYVFILFFGICSIIFVFIGFKLDVKEIQLQTSKQNQQQAELRAQKSEPDQNQLELNYDSEEEAILIRFDLMRAKHRKLQQEILVGIKQLHPFIKIYNEFLIEQPRPARYIIFFLKQCILLSITSIFGKGFSVVQNVFIGIMCIIFTTSLEKLLMHGFNQKISNKIKSFFLLSFIQGTVMNQINSCWYVCIAVSVTLDNYESNQWSFIFFISLIINQVIVEGFTIILKIILAPYLSAILFKGGFIARLIYLYLYDVQAIKIVKDLNMLNTIQF